MGMTVGGITDFLCELVRQRTLLVNEFSRLDKKFSSQVMAKTLSWTSVRAHNIPTRRSLSELPASDSQNNSRPHQANIVDAPRTNTANSAKGVGIERTLPVQ